MSRPPGSNVLKHPDGPTAGAKAMHQAADAYYDAGIVDPTKLASYAKANEMTELLQVLK